MTTLLDSDPESVVGGDHNVCVEVEIHHPGGSEGGGDALGGDAGGPPTTQPDAGLDQEDITEDGRDDIIECV